MSRDLTRKDAGLLLGSPGAPSATCIDERGRLWSPRLRRIARERKRESSYYCQIDAAAISGVFVVLLFIMMITAAPASDHSGSSVDLFQSKNAIPKPWALRYDALQVGIARDGQVFFRFRRAVPNELPGLIRQGIADGAERRIYLTVDRRCRYIDVKTVIDQIQMAKVRDVTVITSAPIFSHR
ncbi:MAG: ExbD/TolR family protein [Candidatus Acidiferrales bacterium]